MNDKERRIKVPRKSDFSDSSMMCYYCPPEWTIDGTSAPKNKGVLRDSVVVPPIAQNFKKTEFAPKSFDRAPKVFTATNELDIICSGNLRVVVSAERADASWFVSHGR
ncbi:hypothetical protein BN1723_009600 [Verticillium longisporum]|uniref:Uncharacterized protein n=1 Tax=Verticillium longisporum TaxID=100787 RepID=A0A0G4KQS1_VERLO|nr:hypothetical protein BN1723_009600 [Verticillium longisporum]CRK28248.1 hypothetical protein BN1708_015144 [Verticillium longisporum]